MNAIMVEQAFRFFEYQKIRSEWRQILVLALCKSRRKSKDAICRLILSGLEEQKNTIILGAATFEILCGSERALREIQSE